MQRSDEPDNDKRTIDQMLAEATRLERLGESDAAKRLLRMAADADSADGMFRLALDAERHQNIPEATRLYTAAAKKGHSSAMFALGLLDEAARSTIPPNVGGAQGPNKAIQARCRSSRIPHETRGNTAEALLFYSRAAEEFSDTDAMNNLACCTEISGTVRLHANGGDEQQVMGISTQ